MTTFLRISPVDKKWLRERESQHLHVASSIDYQCDLGLL